MEARVIPTRYNGYHFRSRTEARWAVVFNSARILFKYEPEGYELPSGRYLPDFLIPTECKHGEDFWIEIKGNHLTTRERKLIEELCVATSMAVVVLVGSPDRYNVEVCRSYSRSPDYVHDAKSFYRVCSRRCPIYSNVCKARGEKVTSRHRRCNPIVDWVNNYNDVNKVDLALCENHCWNKDNHLDYSIITEDWDGHRDCYTECRGVRGRELFRKHLERGSSARFEHGEKG